MTAEERLLAYLAINGPATLARLSQVLGLPRRSVEEAVQNLRLAGNALGSGEDGVWLAHTREEGLEAYRRLRSRALTQLRTCGAVKRAAYRLPSAAHELTLWPS